MQFHRPLIVDRGWMMAALLLLIVLVPTACVVWFMNVTMASQTTAVQQEVVDAYRDQLRVIRNRIHKQWIERAAALEVPKDKNPAEIYSTLVATNAADSAIVVDANGHPVYPPRSVKADTEWLPGEGPHGMAQAVLATEA